MSKEEIRNRRVGTLNSADKFAEVQAEADRITRRLTAGGATATSAPTPAEEADAERQDTPRERVTLPTVQYSKTLVEALYGAYLDFVSRGVEPSTAKELVVAYASLEAAAGIAKALSQVGK